MLMVDTKHPSFSHLPHSLIRDCQSHTTIL